MYVSRESAEETAHRLSPVMAQAEFKVYEQAYRFEEFPLGDFSRKANPEALAFVRDEQVRSQLVRGGDSGGELFRVFSFHFPEALDNSVFVGWLASHLKERVGTGVFLGVLAEQHARGHLRLLGLPARSRRPGAGSDPFPARRTSPIG